MHERYRLNLMKKTIFYAFLFILFIPLLRQINIIPTPDFELDGNFELHSNVELNWHNWVHDVYQKNADVLATENIGYRGFLTRLRNQIDYSLFYLAHSDKAIVGKDDILFDEWYLNAWTGRTFIGEEFIDIKLHKLKMVQDTLRELGTELVFVLAPDKATFFEEKVPAYYQRKRYPQNNYSYLSERAQNIGIDFIDLNNYFTSIKHTCQYPLYPKSGIHWSNYGSYIALDSIIKYIETAKNIDLNDITVDSIEVTTSPKHPDYDIGQNINLLCKIPQWEMAYPSLSFENNQDKPKPKMLVSGDSYYFNIYNYEFTSHLFDNNAFWYYANWVYPEHYKKTTEAKYLDLRKEVEDKDILLLMVTGRFMHNIDWLVVEKLFDAYYPGIVWKSNYDKRAFMHVDHDYFYWLVEEADRQDLTMNEKLNFDADYLLSSTNTTPRDKSVFDYVHDIENNIEWLEKVIAKSKNNGRRLRDQKILDGLYLVQDYNRRVKYQINEIKLNPDWYNNVVEKANVNGISVDEQLKNEAVYVMKDGIVNDGSPEAMKEKELYDLIQKIKDSPEWMKSIEAKALKNNVSTEEQLKLDATWTLENK